MTLHRADGSTLGLRVFAEGEGERSMVADAVRVIGRRAA